MWQKCPLCTTETQASHSIEICTVCDGHKIINQLNGLPPQTTRPEKDYSQTNFGTLENTNYLKANPKAVTAFFRTLKELNDIDNGNNG